jgi:O-acetyl-ADP-ribose deacetylase (regulator of RNase III)
MVSLMIKYTQGNLLQADVEALVNTVNTVGVMGKGIALMFKEQFPENFKAYQQACKDNQVRVGEMFLTERKDLLGPKWIINFPTKDHWRNPSKIEWIEQGLVDLVKVIRANGIQSIAIPPLGSGNGGLKWPEVKVLIEAAVEGLGDVSVVVYEPTVKYQNVAKRSGVEKLTTPRALIAELVRRYSIIGIECTLLEIQKLGYFLERSVDKACLINNLKFKFAANKFGPYSVNMKHLLNELDGSYLHCDRRLADASPFDAIHFDDSKRDYVATYLASEAAKEYRAALDVTSEMIDGFESPFGMELLATVDWLIHHDKIEPHVTAIIAALEAWPSGGKERKLALFDRRVIDIALRSLMTSALYA